MKEVSKTRSGPRRKLSRKMKRMTSTWPAKEARKSANANEKRKPDWKWIYESSNHLADEAAESVEEVGVVVEVAAVDVATANTVVDVATANTVAAVAVAAIVAIAAAVTPAPSMSRTKTPSPVSVPHDRSRFELCAT